MNYKKDFPIFDSKDKLHYLDTAATSQKPKVVIDSIMEYYSSINGNAGRGSHDFAIKSELKINETRKKVAKFINAKKSSEIVFTKNATESLNIIIFNYFYHHLIAGDEVIIAISNHHANLVGWQEICKKTGAILKYIPVDENGDLDVEVYKNIISEKTKVVSFSAMVNTTGVINDVYTISKIAKEYNAFTVVDASQYIHHKRVDVLDIDADFLVFSGHKIFAEFGVGVLYAKENLLNETLPLLYGGEMIEYVEKESSTYKKAPNKFEGGTMNASAINSLGVAIDYVESIGYDNISKHIDELYDYAISKLSEIKELIIYSKNAKEKAGVIAFNVGEVHSHDTSSILNEYGVMVRSGHHCTQPLMVEMNVPSCCRASFSIYNDKEDIDAMVLAIYKVLEIFNIN